MFFSENEHVFDDVLVVYKTENRFSSSLFTIRRHFSNESWIKSIQNRNGVHRKLSCPKTKVNSICNIFIISIPKVILPFFFFLKRYG